MNALLAFSAFFVLAALIRSVIAGDYRAPPPPALTRWRSLGPVEPDPAVEALKADLRRRFAAEDY